MANAEERLLINFRIIAALQPFDRLNAKSSMLSIEPPTWGVSFARWFRADDRQSCITRLNHIIDECKTTLRGKKRSGGTRPRLIEHLESSLTGLVNLKRTYEEDIPTAHAFELLIQNVQQLLRSCGSESVADDSD